MSQQNFSEMKARKTPTSFIQTVKNRKSQKSLRESNSSLSKKPLLLKQNPSMVTLPRKNFNGEESNNLMNKFGGAAISSNYMSSATLASYNSQYRKLKSK